MNYDINNQDFVDFFKRHTGYVLDSISTDWRNEELNPDFDLNLLKSVYNQKFTSDGAPNPLYGKFVPENQMVSIRKVQELTRKKLQQSWDIFTGKRSLSSVYAQNNK